MAGGGGRRSVPEGPIGSCLVTVCPYFGGVSRGISGLRLATLRSVQM